MKKQTKKINKKAEKKITKDMSFAEVMKVNPDSANELMGIGMHCCGCPMSGQETLEQGAMAHGVDADKLVEKLNKTHKNKK
jgi:hybrid cluster-associated redox disulfide protein